MDLAFLVRLEAQVLELTEWIWGQLELRGWAPQDLAGALGWSAARVRRVLLGSDRLPLRDVLTVILFLGGRIDVKEG